jgi:hypothetical protein
MPPARDSRFADLPLRSVRGPDGARRDVVSLRLTGLVAGSSRTYRVVQGDQIDLVAQRWLGDEGLWWQVLDANPLCYPLDLTPGRVIDLPDAGPATRTTRARSF